MSTQRCSFCYWLFTMNNSTYRNNAMACRKMTEMEKSNQSHQKCELFSWTVQRMCLKLIDVLVVKAFSLTTIPCLDS